MRSFVAGVITGALLATIFGRRIVELIDTSTRTARLKLGATVGRAAEGLETARQVIEGGLTREERDGRDSKP